MFHRSAGRPNLIKLAWDYVRTPRFNPIYMSNDNKSVMAFNLSFLFDHNAILQEGVKDLFEWLQKGRIHPLAVKEYSFNNVSQAHRDIESGRTIGKLALIF
jgi:NADPH:quinone reductase-like Zn-dependent oxidoreductase